MKNKTTRRAVVSQKKRTKFKEEKYIHTHTSIWHWETHPNYTDPDVRKHPGGFQKGLRQTKTYNNQPTNQRLRCWFCRSNSFDLTAAVFSVNWKSRPLGRLSAWTWWYLSIDPGSSWLRTIASKSFRKHLTWEICFCGLAHQQTTQSYVNLLCLWANSFLRWTDGERERERETWRSFFYEETPDCEDVALGENRKRCRD